MPAVSTAQRNLMATALHNPGQVSARNRSVLNMSNRQLKEFVVGPRTAMPKRKMLSVSDLMKSMNPNKAAKS